MTVQTSPKLPPKLPKSTSTNTSAAKQQKGTWWKTFQNKGYYANYVAVATIMMGVYLHVTRLFIGDDLLLQYVFTPVFDMVLAVPMAYAGILGILNWKRVQFHNTMHKIGYGLATFYIAGSIPLHVQTYLTWSTDYITWFPIWYSAALMPLYASIILLMWRLKYKQSAE